MEHKEPAAAVRVWRRVGQKLLQDEYRAARNEGFGQKATGQPEEKSSRLMPRLEPTCS